MCNSIACPGSRAKGNNVESPGFTLLELVLAVFIFSLVIGILSVSLTFSLRVWRKQQDQKPPDVPNILELMKAQVANFDPVPVRLDEESKFLFQGSEHSLSLTTDRSVKAISKGIPVIARYVFQEKDQKLYYSEMVLDPYHPESIQKFLKMTPGKEKQWPQFYAVDVIKLSFSYSGNEDGSGYAETWDNSSTIPSSVIVKCITNYKDVSTSYVQIMTPNSFFPISSETMQKALTSQANQPQHQGGLQ